MTEKELREIKRRLKPEKSNISRIVGCFVNTNREIISRISHSVITENSVISEKLLAVMRRALSGSLGANLTDISFSTKQVTESEEHKLLMGLVRSGLSDADLLERFYRNAIEGVKIDGNYVILLANDRYDVFSRHSDGTQDESSEMFSYIVCAVCPVKNLNEALSLGETDGLFHLLSPSDVLAAPEIGFMFPAFDDRKTNIYGALYYTRSLSDSYAEFTKGIFDSEPPMPPKIQRETFGDCLSDALSEECSFEVLRDVHIKLGEMIEEHNEMKSEEPLTVSKASVKSMLADCGVGEEKLERLGEAFDDGFGINAELAPKNIIPLKKFEITAPNVSVKVDPEHKDDVSVRQINGVNYIMIRVDAGAELNGIKINFEDQT